MPQPIRAVILTAHPIEYAAVRTHLSNLREETHPKGTIYERGTFTTQKHLWEIGIVQIEIGNASAASAAERAIAHFDPSVVLFVGIADGFKDVRPGDVVVATKIYGYEAGKAYGGTIFLPRPDVGQSSYRLVERAKADARKTDWYKRIPAQSTTSDSGPHVLVGPIAAGEKIVSSMYSAIFQLLQITYGDTLAIETEGRGFLLAAHENEQVQALVIHGITQLITNKRKNENPTAQAIAAHNASAFAIELLANLDVAQTVSTQMQDNLRLVHLAINEEHVHPVLAITLQNAGTQAALPTQARIDILDVAEFYYETEDDVEFGRAVLASTCKYKSELSPHDKGRRKTITIAHILQPNEVDRFEIELEQEPVEEMLAYVWYYLKITLLHNEQEMVLEASPLLLSIPPVEIVSSMVQQPAHLLQAPLNRAALRKMAPLPGKRSASVEEALRQFL